MLRCSSTMSTEVELKLTVSPASARKAQHLPWLRNAAMGPISQSEISSVYFDTETLKLRRHGVTLRVRRTGSKHIQTIKGTAGVAGELGRAEWEDVIKSAQPQLKHVNGTLLAPLVTKKLKRKLKPLFRTAVHRSVLNLQVNESTIELAFDRGTIAA